LFKRLIKYDESLIITNNIPSGIHTQNISLLITRSPHSPKKADMPIGDTFIGLNEKKMRSLEKGD